MLTGQFTADAPGHYIVDHRHLQLAHSHVSCSLQLRELRGRQRCSEQITLREI